MEYYNLTTSQKNIDRIKKLCRGTSISNLCGAMIFDRKYKRELLEKSINIILEKQDAMRLTVCCSDKETVQYIREYRYEKTEYRTFLSVEDMKMYGEKIASEVLPDNTAYMYHFIIFDLPDRSGVMLRSDHMISDAWSYSIIAGEIFRIYSVLADEKEDESQSYSYTDHILREHRYFESEQFEKDRAFWNDFYSFKPEKTIVRSVKKNKNDIRSGRCIKQVSTSFADSVKSFCCRNEISESALFESAVLIYLAKINPDNSTVTIGVPVLDRSSSAEKKTVGMFISTVPLTIHISEDESAFSVFRKTGTIRRNIYRHRKYPYENLIRDLKERTGFSGNLYDVMVSFQNAVTNSMAETIWFSNGCSDIPLSFNIDDRDCSDGYTLTVDYQKIIFSDSEAEMFAERILHIIDQIINNFSITVKEVSVVPEKELEKLVYELNNTSVAYESEKCVHEIFTEIASVNPDKTALVFNKEEFTYAQLDQLSDSLAYFLRSRGIGRNDVVPVIARRSPNIIIAMLGIMKSGAAYMPVSPEYPEERIRYMTETSGAKLAVVSGFSCGYIDTVSLDDFDWSVSEKTDNINTSEDLCYVIFTSGSTGKPKGTAITHKNTVNYCSSNKFNVSDRITGKEIKSIVSVTNFIFDIFVTESIFALLNGIKIILADENQVTSQKEISRLITENCADMIQTTPSKMRSYIFDRNNTAYLAVLKKIVLGGEEFPSDLYTLLSGYTDADIYNIYGPAETTVWATVSETDGKEIVLGTPLANTRIYILDRNSFLVPFGVVGEICIAGECVGNGYLNDEEKTSEKFVKDPFYKGQMMYHTGDLGLIRSDGNIEFFGRADTQIKLHGLRIEAGDIESALSSLEGIGISAVICINDENGGQHLAAYYVSDREIDENKLRKYLSENIPAYMMPHYFTRLDEMPVTPSGKTDRKALPYPDIQKKLKIYEEPANDMERVLCSLVSKITGVGKTGVSDDFFELGGDSFTAMEFVAAAGETGIVFSIKDLYEHSTVRSLYTMLSENEITDTVQEENSINEFPFSRNIINTGAFRLFSWFTRLMYKFSVDGLERLDSGEKYILCPNHESDLDCMWVWTALSRIADINNTCAMIASEHLDKIVSRFVFRTAGGIPVDRKGDFAPALRRASEVLKNERRYLLVHPEGTRTRTGMLGNFKKGAALISIETGVKVVPVYIEGSGRIYPVSRKLPKIFDVSSFRRFPLGISFGTPVDPEGKNAEQITDEIKNQIIMMQDK